MLEDGAADETDALVTALNKSKLQRSGPSFEPTSNPKVTRYYDTDDDDDYIEVEEVELSAEELKAMRGPFGLPQRNAERRSPPQRRPQSARPGASRVVAAAYKPPPRPQSARSGGRVVSVGARPRPQSATPRGPTPAW